MTTAFSTKPLKSRTLESLHLARTPRITRVISRCTMIVLIAAPILLCVLPWTQNVHGQGRAIAFNPILRPQFIVSPIEGRIKKWFVVEGDRVYAGQRILELVDNDPNLEARLLDEERAILDRLRASESRVRDIEARIRNLENSRSLALAVQDSILRVEQARLAQSEQEQLEAAALLDAAMPNYERTKKLYESNVGVLASMRELEVAERDLRAARAKATSAKAKVEASTASVKASTDMQQKIDADTSAMINLEKASFRSAQGEVASIRRDKAQMEVRIARQRAQYVDAPCNGTVFRLLANSEDGGILVRPGERLTIIVPDIEPREAGMLANERRLSFQVGQLANLAITKPIDSLAPLAWLASTEKDEVPLTTSDHPGIVCELFVDGNDIPLIHKGDRVRLQFEGWPAVQFVGWPSVAVGTFGGRVYLVDPTSNEKGQFRILVEPDPTEPAWPDQKYLRQGVRAHGWVLLEQVPLGWEFWRNLNGFPPIREIAASKGASVLGPVNKKVKK